MIEHQPKSISSRIMDVARSLHENEDGMLILVRKVQQSIWIEGGINIQVLSIERDRVKLGITAPNDVKVMRQELLLEGQDPQTFGKRNDTATGQTEITTDPPIPGSKTPPQG